VKEKFSGRSEQVEADLNIPAIKEEKTLQMTQRPSDHDGPEPHPKYTTLTGATEEPAAGHSSSAS